MKFLDLVAHIAEVDGAARLVAGRSLQRVLSLRNWLIGASLVEFEQAGEDRARYGQRLMSKLSRALAEAGCEGLSTSNLKNFRQVTLAYPGLDAAAVGRRLAFPEPRFRQNRKVARLTSWLVSLSLRRIFSRWRLIVASDIARVSAISLVRIPLRIMLQIAISVGVSEW